MYGRRSVRNLPVELRNGSLVYNDGIARVRDSVRECVQFHHLNLVSTSADQWARSHGPFDAIFC